MFLIAFTSVVPAQQAQQTRAEWTRIESNNKEFSVALPSGFLVHVDNSTAESRRTLVGFVNGVTVRVTIVKQFNAKGNLGRVRVEQSRNPVVLDFQFGDFFGKTVTYRSDGYKQDIYLASDSSYYSVSVAANSGEVPEVARLLQSIRLEGKPFIEGDSGKADEAATVVRVKALVSSPQVKEALDRKAAKVERKINFEPLTSFAECGTDHTVRPAMIVADMRQSAFVKLPRSKKNGELKIKYQLRADGTVGEITFYSDMDRSSLKGFADAAKEIRFVAAERSGSPVDSCTTVPIWFESFSYTRVISI
ncbi:MAG: hypothetical protein ABI791_08520 [Acidobacteriota bacterium]